MRTFVHAILSVGILAACLALPSASFAAASKNTAAAPKNTAAHLFKADCSRCHGMDGKGIAAIRSPNFTSPKWQASHSDQRIVSMITNGEKGTLMPAWKGKLTSTQIRSLEHYVRSFNSANKLSR